MKKALTLALAFLLMFSLVACGGTSSSAPASTPAPASSSAASSAGTSASTDNYPTKPIVDIVCTSAGGSTDLYNRLMGTYIEKYLGQGFVIENVTGGAQVIGTTKLADSEPDGYTLGGGWSASFGMRPYLLEVTYDVDDFTFVCGILDQIEACIVRSDAKWNTLDELMEDLKNDPSIKYGAGNAGSFQYVWARYVMNQKGVNGVFVPHNGDADALTSLLGGAVDFVFAETTSAMSGIKSGDYRVLATCKTERDPATPDAPCLTELGYECVLSHTMSLIFPAGVPEERVQKVYSAVEQVMKDEEFLEQCKKSGFAPVFKTGEEIRQEIDDLAAIIRPMIEAGEFD
ncbi:recombinase RecA [Eubacteriales bacterium]|nr:recombinase RecA [Eubacteriales bacterium]GKH62407.1 recombinase RecA [Eubacteriales bacterium]